MHEPRRADVAGAGGADAGRLAGEAGLNLKPSGRMHAPSSLEEGATGKTVGEALLENPVFRCQDVSVFYEIGRASCRERV